MVQPSVTYFIPAAPGAFSLQVVPAGNQGYFVISPATNNGANDTHITAFNGTAAVAANCIGMNICRVNSNIHAKARMAKPFTNGLFVNAHNNNINWLIYTWMDDLD